MQARRATHAVSLRKVCNPAQGITASPILRPRPSGRQGKERVAAGFAALPSPSRVNAYFYEQEWGMMAGAWLRS
jgi:hypothetical protein